MNERWRWLPKYAAVIVVAVFLAAALGSTELFKGALLVDSKVSASHLVRVLGYGAALVFLWLAVQRVRAILREDGAERSLLARMLLPLAALVMLGSAHGTLLLVLDHLLDGAVFQTYNWLFIAGITGCTIWLIFTLCEEPTRPSAFTGAAAPRDMPEPLSRRCTACEAQVSADARYCNQCGAPLAVADTTRYPD
jgi:hypothetical protein